MLLPTAFLEKQNSTIISMCKMMHNDSKSLKKTHIFIINTHEYINDNKYELFYKIIVTIKFKG